jgi:enterobactin synthetase component D
MDEMNWSISHKPYEVIERGATPYGIYFALSLPTELQPIPSVIWNRLHKEEQHLAQELKGFRKINFVGGRLAAKKTLQSIQREHLSVTSDPFGAPQVSAPLSISISHKNDVAIALLSRQPNTTIGIDIEALNPARPNIASKILTPREKEIFDSLPPERQWGFLLLSFSTKESIFKALAPRLKRYIDFSEAEVFPTTHHTSKIQLHLKDGSLCPKEINARYTWNSKYVITSVQAIWT